MTQCHSQSHAAICLVKYMLVQMHCISISSRADVARAKLNTVIFRCELSKGHKPRSSFGKG